MTKKLLFVVGDVHYFISHRLALARYAKDQGLRVGIASTADASQWKAVKQKLEHEGFSVFHVPFHRSRLNPFKELPTLFALMRVYLQYKPCVVHHVALKPIIYGGIVAKICRVPKIIHAVAGFGYTFTATSKKAHILSFLVRTLFKGVLRNTSVIVQNHTDADTIRKWLTHKASVTLLLGAGVDVPSTSRATKHHAAHATLLENTRQIPADAATSRITDHEPRPFVAVCAARMLWTKGVKELVDAAQRLRKTHAHIQIHLVGAPDPLNPASVPATYLEKHHREGHITWHGHVENIQKVYEKGHVAVLPSHREGLPKSLLEACATGLPILTTCVPGCFEVLMEGEPVSHVTALQPMHFDASRPHSNLPSSPLASHLSPDEHTPEECRSARNHAKIQKSFNHCTVPQNAFSTSPQTFLCCNDQGMRIQPQPSLQSMNDILQVQDMHVCSNGVLVKAYSAQAIARALIHMSEMSEEKRSAMGGASLKKAQNLFEMSIISQKTFALYQDTCIQRLHPSV